MAKNLVIVESPAKARTLNRYLGKDFEVTASMGHVRDLPKSRFGIDVENNFEPHYVTIQKARKTVNQLKKKAKNKIVWLAADPDREGEAISWHLAFLLEPASKTIQRVTFNEITKTAVLAAFEKPRIIDMNLVNAQQARRFLDRMVGYNISPLLWKNVARGLSAGRVQSVALRLIVEREEEIDKFVPQEYWTIAAHLASQRKEEKRKVFESNLDRVDGKKPDINNEKNALELKAEIEKQSFVVSDINTSKRRRKPQAPYTTSKLQQEAYNRLHFPAQKTMRLAQSLYEGVDIGAEETVGLITYMRTDSVNVSQQALTDVREFVGKTYGKDYLPETPNKYKAKGRAQEAHEAVRPTSVERTPEVMKSFLSGDELKLYDLIWRKFVASQMTEAVDEQLSVQIQAGSRFQFRSTGTKNIFPGFTAALPDAKPRKKKKDGDEEGPDEEEPPNKNDLPHLKKDEPLDLKDLNGAQHFTKPPARYNDASLVKILEENGIGRPSTYAPTIQTLVFRHYVTRKGGALHPSDIGKTVITLLKKHFANIIDYQFTAQMESELDQVEEGEYDWKQVLKEFYAPFSTQVDAAKDTMENMKEPPKPTDYKCDECGKPLVIKRGRFGEFLACTGFPECKFTKSIPTGHKCPQCSKDIVKRRSRRGQIFYGCSGYPDCNYATNKLPEEENQQSSDKDGTSESSATSSSQPESKNDSQSSGQ